MKPVRSKMARAGWLSLTPALALLALPLVCLFGETQFSDLHAAYGDWRAVGVSLRLSVWAIIMIVIVGTPLSIWLARSQSRLTRYVDILVFYSMLVPSLAMGILLVSAYGPYGPLGRLFAEIGVSLNNNASSFVLAQVYGGLAWYVTSARTAFDNVAPEFEEAAYDLGAPPLTTFFSVTLPLSSRAIVTAVLLAWVRIVGEFGIVAVFSYFPQGIPVKLFVDLQDSGIQAVYVLTWILLLLMLPFPFVVTCVLQRVRTTQQR
ncbi:ABC transporter permease subunit [Paraburkholderia sp. CNPSo 3274]|nr:ABC transporter permease subunit [Paraburkholderia sp. CNPSo 3274]